MATTVRSDLHECLRQATKASHRLLDHHPLLAPLVRSDLTLVQYGDALTALYGVYAPLEEGIDNFLGIRPALFDYHRRRKLPALKDDLAALGRVPRNREMRYVVPTTVAELVGVLYTVEGSTMGGRSIARCLRLGGFAVLPTRFFSGYGEDTEVRWREFLAFADETCPIADRKLAAASAVLLFQAIKMHLDEWQLGD